MSAVLQILLWVLVGVLFGGLHLLLLRRSVERVKSLDSMQAKQGILRGLPIRLLCWAPVLVLAARAGLLACAALVVGSMLVRWMAWLLVRHRWSPAFHARD